MVVMYIINPGLKHLAVRLDAGKMVLSIVFIHFGVTGPPVPGYDNRGFPPTGLAFLAPIHASNAWTGYRKFPVSVISMTWLGMVFEVVGFFRVICIMAVCFTSKFTSSLLRSCVSMHLAGSKSLWVLVIL